MVCISDNSPKDMELLITEVRVQKYLPISTAFQICILFKARFQSAPSEHGPQQQPEVQQRQIAARSQPRGRGRAHKQPYRLVQAFACFGVAIVARAVGGQQRI